MRLNATQDWPVLDVPMSPFEQGELDDISEALLDMIRHGHEATAGLYAEWACSIAMIVYDRVPREA